MDKADDLLEKLLWAFARRASGRTVVVVAAVLYGGLGLAVPLLLDWSVPWLVAANILGTMTAGLVILLWLVAQVQAQQRRHLVEWTSDLRLLDAQEFEWLVGEVFRREGWDVEETGRQDAPDGNIDLRLFRQGRRILVQCKRWTSWQVGVDDVRAFAGTLMREGLPGDAGVFVTLSSFGSQARGEAERIHMTLIDNRDLYARVEAARRLEPCPICGAGMVLDRSSRGWWFRCVQPGCSGKRDLGADPARAIEILTKPPTEPDTRVV